MRFCLFILSVLCGTFLAPVKSSDMILVLRNRTLKYWIQNDMTTLKRLSQFRIRTYERMGQWFQRMITFYYDSTYNYYSMNDDDRELMSNIIDLLL